LPLIEKPVQLREEEEIERIFGGKVGAHRTSNVAADGEVQVTL
jgi:hypothetical protein